MKLNSWQQDVVDLMNDGVGIMAFVEFDYTGESEPMVGLLSGKVLLSDVNCFRRRLNDFSWDDLKCYACNHSMMKDTAGPLTPVLHVCTQCGQKEGTYSAIARCMDVSAD